MDLFDRILIVSTNLKPYSEDDIQELIQNKSAGISLTYSCNGVTNPISIFFFRCQEEDVQLTANAANVLMTYIATQTTLDRAVARV